MSDLRYIYCGDSDETGATVPPRKTFFQAKLTRGIAVAILAVFLVPVSPGISAEPDPEPPAPIHAQPELPEVPSLIADDAMIEFLDKFKVHRLKSPQQKATRILEGLFGPHGDGFRYEAHLSLPPSESFARREGNCISFAMLFVTLARASGMHAQFNDMDMLPQWNVHGELVIETGHVNVMVSGHRADFIVELLIGYREIAEFYRNPIPDQQVLSNYFNNLAIHALVSGDGDHALALLHRATEIDPENASVWQNIGVFWNRLGDDSKAEEALLKAASFASKKPSVYFTLSRFYKSQGDTRKALSYGKMGEQYARKNPFYHLLKGITARDAGNYRASKKHIRKAIDILPDYHRFYYELALTWQADADLRAYRKYILKAIDRVEGEEIRQRYESELQSALANSS